MRPTTPVRRLLVRTWLIAALGGLVACGGPLAAAPAACAEPTDLAPLADETLAAAVRAALGVATGPTCEALATLEHLDVYDLGVASLAGLEHAHALVSLQADRNAIEDVTPLAGLSELRWLWFGGNQVSDIAPLAGLSGLRGISFWGNPVASVAPIAGMTHLERAFIGIVPARDHHLLADLTSLQVLHVPDSGLSDLAFVAGMSELEEFFATWNDAIGDASVLATATNLVRLDLGDTGLTDVAFLAALPNLRHVALWGNEIADTGPIEALTDLVHLDIGGTGMSDLSMLANSPELEVLHAWANGLSDVSPLESLGALRMVGISGNLISDIGPLVANVSLGSDTRIELEWNCLDLTPGSTNRNDIDALLGRGVDVSYEPQRDGC